MHVLQWRLVVVADSHLVRRLHKKGIVEAGVPDVVADRPDYHSEALLRAEEVLGLADAEEPEEGEGRVDRVGPVVVGRLPRVPVAQRGALDEAGAGAGPLRGVGARVARAAVVVGQDSVADGEPRGLADVQDVEVPAVEVLPRDARVEERLVHLLEEPLLLGAGLRAACAGEPALVRRGARGVALEHRPLGAVELAEGLRVQGRLLRIDLAQRRQLLEHALQDLRLVAEARPVLLVGLVLLVVVLPSRLAAHGGHRAEDLGGNLLDVAEQQLQGDKDDGGHGVHEHEAGGHHEDHDGRDQEAVAEGVDLLGALEAELQGGAAAGVRDLDLAARPRGRFLRELPRERGAVGQGVVRFEREVGALGVEGLEVGEDPSEGLGRAAARHVAELLGPHPHGEVGLGVGQELEERQDHDHDDDEAGDARGECHVELPGNDLGRAGAPLILEAWQEAEQLHELCEAAGPGAQLRHSRRAHDHGVVEAARQSIHDKRVVQGHGQNPHQVHPEEERAGVTLGEAYDLH
mmetsp:Transcript_33595/g.96545  ORF Transcript_33595/g.96545 Transcript_33595/m.96545 type:complete len:519 (+) Transcript_33595:662-2218(+)